MSGRPRRDTKPPNRFEQNPAPAKTTSHSPPADLQDSAPPAKKPRLTTKTSGSAEPTPAAATKKKPPVKGLTKKAKAEQAAAQLAATEASTSERAAGAISGDSKSLESNRVEDATKTLHVQSTPGPSNSTPKEPMIISPLPATLSSTMHNPKRPASSLSNPKNKGSTPLTKKESSAKTADSPAPKASQTTDVNLQDAATRRRMLYGSLESAPSFKKVSFVRW